MAVTCMEEFILESQDRVTAQVSQKRSQDNLISYTN